MSSKSKVTYSNLPPLPSIQDFISGRVKTLGWGALEWMSNNLAQPDGDRAGDPLTLSNEQALFILRYYAVDEYGKWLYRRAILMRAKGWGKSPLLAAMCCLELLGPTRFSHWDTNGNPIGKAVSKALVQIAAPSEDQCNNTYSLVREMLLLGPAYQRYDLEGCIMTSKVATKQGGLIQKVTASFRGREGERVTFLVADETHHWVPANKGIDLFDVIRRNAAKVGNRFVETTNAPVPGQGSVAEISHKAVEEQLEKTGTTNILLDTRTAFISDEDIHNKEVAMPILEYVYGDSAQSAGGWVDLESIWNDVIDPATTIQTARRFYFNQRVEGESGWVSQGAWLQCQSKDVKPLKKGDLVAFGFTGATRSGATALVACRLKDLSLWVLEAWEKPPSAPLGWELSYKKVDLRVRRQTDKYDVYLAYFNPQNFQDIGGRWHADYEDTFEELWFSSRNRWCKAVEQFESAVYDRRLVFKPDDRLTQHILNCHVDETPQGKVIRTETRGSTRYIAIAQAAVLAYEAAIESIERGALKEGADKYVYSF